MENISMETVVSPEKMPSDWREAKQWISYLANESGEKAYRAAFGYATEKIFAENGFNRESLASYDEAWQAFMESGKGGGVAFVSFKQGEGHDHAWHFGKGGYEKEYMEILTGANPEGLSETDRQTLFGLKGAAQKTGVSARFTRERPEPDSELEYMETRFNKDQERHAAYKPLMTGFKGLDGATGGMHPGLYVIGGASSVGKTTFALQMACSFAECGSAAVYFTLEQSRLEISTKNLSRMSAEADRPSAKTALEIRKGGTSLTSATKAARERYAKISAKLSIVGADIVSDVEGLRAYVGEYIRMHAPGERPAVFVDYLQILKAEGHTDKERADAAVTALKRMSAEHEITVVAIASFNRASYTQEASLESLKESGGIEYAADAVWALELEAMRGSGEKSKAKWADINRAKTAMPRDIRLTCLKNRFGKAYFETSFDYYPNFELYAEAASRGNPKTLR